MNNTEHYFMHLLNEDGSVNWQGNVIEKLPTHWLVERFSCFDGSPTDVIPVPIDIIMNPNKVRLYTDHLYWARMFDRKVHPVLF